MMMMSSAQTKSSTTKKRTKKRKRCVEEELSTCECVRVSNGGGGELFLLSKMTPRLVTGFSKP